MTKLIVLIIILVAVLSTPLTLKKLIDQANRRKGTPPTSKTYKSYDDDDDWP